MKDEQFDDLVRGLANGLSRRGMLKKLGAGLVATVAGTFFPGAARLAEAVASGVGLPSDKLHRPQSDKEVFTPDIHRICPPGQQKKCVKTATKVYLQNFEECNASTLCIDPKSPYCNRCFEAAAQKALDSVNRCIATSCKSKPPSNVIPGKQEIIGRNAITIAAVSDCDPAKEVECRNDASDDALIDLAFCIAICSTALAPGPHIPVSVLACKTCAGQALARYTAKLALCIRRYGCTFGVCCGTTCCGTLCCGTTCCPEGAKCVNGKCAHDACMSVAGLTASAALTSCDGQCVDLEADPNNCGGCGNACTDRCAPSCVAGQCAPIDCGDPCLICENGNCIPVDCGPCAECQNGACVPIDCGHPCLVCQNGSCVPIACGVGESCCNGQCIDLATDSANCGGCGNACSQFGPNHVCVSGQCICPHPCGMYCCAPEETCLGGTPSICSGCPSGQWPCPDGCVDLATDNNNCGGCGNVCTNYGPYHECINGGCRCSIPCGMDCCAPRQTCKGGPPSYCSNAD